MDDKITVIVPVYNVENYLRKCLDSIITQTYKNIEIVVVNDGSTDASGEICKEFSEMDHRILYIEQENAGLSAARNTGLNNMSGNYVTFVDSDDWIELDYVETLYKEITEYQADIAVGNYYSFNESEGMFYFHISGDSYYEKVYDNVSIFENLYETQEMRSFALISAWGKLYKARLFEQLRFDMGKLGEDGYLNQKVYLLSEKVIYLNKSLYAYRIRKGSLSRIWTEKWMHALVDAMSERITLLANMGYPLEKHLAIYRQMLEFSLSNGQASGLSDTATYKEFEMKQRLLNQLSRQEESEKKAIVLAANYAYVDQVLTTIKSICYHNRSIRFYLIHSDFPNEWIKQLNKRLEKFDSEIINCRVTSEQISCYKSDISYTVFLRYFIADFVQEDKALYLDCDLVVTKNLDDLFATDLQDYRLAAVRDFGGRAYFGQEIFNAGVLLVNNALWKDLAAQTYREVWWYYHGLEWTELGQNHHLHPLQRSHIYPIKEPFTCLIYTASDHIEQIETLVQSLPDIQFKIAARVIVSDRLAQMTIYPNVTIFNGIHYLVDVDNELVETSQVLLDINHGEKTEEIINQFARLGKTILSFENTKTYEAGQEAYAVDQVQAMIEKLREISK